MIAICTEFLDRFADTFDRHDLDDVMSMMTNDCVFLTSAGNEIDGKRIAGQAVVRKAFAAVITAMPDAKWQDGEHIIEGDRARTRWLFAGATAEGARVEQIRVDLFHFRGGKIWIKDTLRKPPLPLS